jgi:hypothetical protein
MQSFAPPFVWRQTETRGSPSIITEGLESAGTICRRLKYSTIFTSFSLMFIAATIALARSAGDAVVLQTGFVVRSSGPWMQSGNCIVHAGETSKATTAVDAIVRIFGLELENCNRGWDLGRALVEDLSNRARKVGKVASSTLYTNIKVRLARYRSWKAQPRVDKRLRPKPE